MKNILVTGATGFIGSHLVSKLQKENNVLILGRDQPPSPWTNWLSTALNHCASARGNILNQNLIRRLLAEYNIEIVYHLAAQAIVSAALKDPFGTLKTNILGTTTVLEACRQIDVEKVLFLSTDKVYGEREKAVDAIVDDPVVAGGPYETSKSCADLIAQGYLRTYDMNIVIPRSCNAYGYDLSKRIIPNTIRSCLRGEAPVAYEPDNTQRQYIYVEDLADALIHLAKHAYKGNYNIATNDILTQKQVVIEICKYFSISPKFLKRERPIKEIKFSSMLCSEFGWKPQHTFSEGIQETIRRFKKFGF